MKKIIAFVMAAVMCLSFTACTPKSQEVKQTEIMIRAIEEVTDQSGEAIVLAEHMYHNLSAEEKGQVKNYSSLTQAREKYNQLIHYGQWVRFFDKEAVNFTLNEGGSFTMSDGRSGKYEITDSFVTMLTDEGEAITLEKETHKNLLHIERDIRGLAKDYWYSLQIRPSEDYIGIVAPGTELTLTLKYTTSDVATLRKTDAEELLITEELSDPVQQEKTITVTAENFMSGECCNPEYDLVRGVSSQFKDYQSLFKKLELIEDAELVSAEGTLCYYGQLLDTAWGGLYLD